MRAPAISPVGHLGRLTCIFAAVLLAAAMMTIPAKADEPSGTDGADEAAVAAESTDDISGAESSVASAAATAAGSESAGAPTLAGYLSSGMLRVSADVALVDGDDEAVEPVVGSFTVDGLTYAAPVWRWRVWCCAVGSSELRSLGPRAAVRRVRRMPLARAGSTTAPWRASSSVLATRAQALALTARRASRLLALMRIPTTRAPASL